MARGGAKERRSRLTAARRAGPKTRRRYLGAAPESEDLHRNPLRLANSPALAQFPEGFRNFT
jgi:hypothetical protein